jgi:hypothetical protein
MDRALDTLHRRKRIEYLVTRPLEGGQQMAYYWAVRARIARYHHDTNATRSYHRLDWSRGNRDIVQRFPVDVLVIFAGRAEPHIWWSLRKTMAYGCGGQGRLARLTMLIRIITRKHS